MFCKNCGAKIDDTAKFCPSCGTAIDVAPAAPAAPATPPPYGAGSAPTTPPPAYGAPGYGAPGAPGAPYGAPGYGAPAYGAAPVQRKSKIAAALLAFFLGGLGIHNFYLGKKGIGLAQLLITLLTCGLGGVVVSVWAFVEFIMILLGNITDANGQPLE